MCKFCFVVIYVYLQSQIHREKGSAFFFIPFFRLHGTKATFRIRLLLTINMPFLSIMHIIFHLFGANKTSIFMPFADTDRMHSLSFRSNWKCHHILEHYCIFFSLLASWSLCFAHSFAPWLVHIFFATMNCFVCVSVCVCLCGSLFVYLFEMYLALSVSVCVSCSHIPFNASSTCFLNLLFNVWLFCSQQCCL